MDGSYDRMFEPDTGKQHIREFVTPIAEQAGVRTFADTDSLTDAGVLSSMALFRIVAFLEQTFSISVEDEEIVLEHFDSINRIHSLVSSKLARS